MKENHTHKVIDNLGRIIMTGTSSECTIYIHQSLRAKKLNPAEYKKHNQPEPVYSKKLVKSLLRRFHAEHGSQSNKEAAMAWIEANV